MTRTKLTILAALFAMSAAGTHAKDSPQLQPQKSWRAKESVPVHPRAGVGAGKVILLRYPASIDPSVQQVLANSYASARTFPGSYSCVSNGYADRNSLTAAIARTVYFSYDVYSGLRATFPDARVILSPGRITQDTDRAIAVRTDAPPADVYVDFFAFEHPCDDNSQGLSTRGRKVLPIFAISVPDQGKGHRLIAVTHSLVPLIGASPNRKPDIALLFNSNDIAYAAMTQEPGVKGTLPVAEYRQLWDSAGSVERMPFSAFEVLERADSRWEIAPVFHAVLARTVTRAIEESTKPGSPSALEATLKLYDPAASLSAISAEQRQRLDQIREAELQFSADFYGKALTEYSLGSSGLKMSALIKEEAGMDRDRKVNKAFSLLMLAGGIAGAAAGDVAAPSAAAQAISMNAPIWDLRVLQGEEASAAEADRTYQTSIGATSVVARNFEELRAVLKGIYAQSSN